MNDREKAKKPVAAFSIPSSLCYQASAPTFKTVNLFDLGTRGLCTSRWFHKVTTAIQVPVTRGTAEEVEVAAVATAAPHWGPYAVPGTVMSLLDAFYPSRSSK